MIPTAAMMVAVILVGTASVSYADAVDTPSYLAMGADLTSSEKQKVYDLLGIQESNLDAYNVIEITNEDEHDYLDSYLTSSVIGTRALSCVLINASDEGEGITVDTTNITYCTEGMYKNALTTAGVEDAEVHVVGPYNISGTAALVGAMKAYEEMSGEEISEEAQDTATNELVVSGELAEEVGDSDKVEEFIAYLKERVASGELSSDEEIEEAIDEGSDTFELSLTDEQKETVLELMKKIDDLNLNVDSLKQQASDIYEKLNDMGLSTQAQGIWDKIVSFVKGILN